MWEGLARQASIEHLPRSRTRGSSLSRTGSDNGQNTSGTAFGRRPTALSAVSIPEEEGEQRHAPLASPVTWPVGEAATNGPPFVQGTEGRQSPERRTSDSSENTLAEAAHPNDASNEKAAEVQPKEEVDVEKRGTSRGEQTSKGEGKAPGDTLSQRLSKRLTIGSRKKTEADFHDDFEIILKDHPDLDPHNSISEPRKWFLTALVGLMVLNSTFASSAPSNLIPEIIEHFNVSREVGTLTISIFVAAYCAGPLIWGPASEQIGRRKIFLISFVPYVGFQVGAALSKNIGSLLVFRFLGGLFASSPLTNSGGVIADIFDSDKRGVALAIFSLMPFMGPAIAPTIAGAFAVRGVYWRWIFWFLAIFAGVCFFLLLFFLPETYVPQILKNEAARKRKETGDDRYWTAAEHPGQKESLKDILDRTVAKPFIMIFEEPMLMVLTLYMSFVYGIIYLLFEAVPIIFGEAHGLNILEVGLCFIALPVGGTIAVLFYIFYFNKKYMKKHHSIKPKMVPPEQRLHPLMYSAPLFAASFFWIGLTGAPASVSIWSPLVGLALLGGCVLYVFLGVFNYLIDAYLAAAASALAINTVVRSAFGAGFPLFATQMFNKLGIRGASCLLGGIAILFVPAPFVLYKYGRTIRGWSKHAKVLD